MANKKTVSLALAVFEHGKSVRCMTGELAQHVDNHQDSRPLALAVFEHGKSVRCMTGELAQN